MLSSILNNARSENNMITIRNQSVNVDREELVKALKENLAAHTVELAEAVSDYKALVKKSLSEALARAEAGKFDNVSVVIQKPEDHTREFTDMIEMLEMSTDTVINLDREAFRAYVKNEWPWKKNFDALAASYKMSGSL